MEPRPCAEPEVLPREECPDTEASTTSRTGRSPRKSAGKAPKDYVDFEDLDRREEPDADADEDSDSDLDADTEPNDEDLSRSLPAVRGAARDVEVASEIADDDVRAVSPSDPLRRYMEEVRRYPLLDPKEEFELAVKLRDTGDMEAAKRLVQANLRLVVKIAFEYKTYYTNLLDLVQEGNIGLMKAVSKFDPAKGARLGYYSSWWIRSYILKYLLDNFRLVKVGTTQAQKKLFYHLMREKERLEAQGLLAGPKLLAEKLNVREKDVVEMEHRLSGRGAEMSLDAPVNSESENSTSHLDLLSDTGESADEQLARDELLRMLQDRLPEFEKSLNEKELRLLKDRLLAEEPKTLQEVADLYGLTRERARQIEAKVISKLRDFFIDGEKPRA